MDNVQAQMDTLLRSHSKCIGHPLPSTTMDTCPNSAPAPKPERALSDKKSDLRNILLRERRYPPIRIALAVEALTELGAKSQDLLRACDLQLHELQDPQVRVSSLQLLGVLRNAVSLGLGPGIGLRVGLRFHASCYGMLGYALLCAPTLRATFDTGLRYYQLGNGMFAAEWLEQDNAAIWRFTSDDLLGLPDTDPALASVIRDLSLASLITIFKDVMGQWCVPVRVVLHGEPPPHAAEIEQALGCPLVFRQPYNEVHYPAAWLERSPQLANPITAAQVSQECARLLEQWNWQRGDTTRRVVEQLTRNPGHFPTLEALATTLCMTSRTLRRRLEAEGSSYSALLDEVRCALAQDYLRTPKLSIDDIAAALDFSDTASFRRAYKRWTGKTPITDRSR